MQTEGLTPPGARFGPFSEPFTVSVSLVHVSPLHWPQHPGLIARFLGVQQVSCLCVEPQILVMTMLLGGLSGCGRRDSGTLHSAGNSLVMDGTAANRRVWSCLRQGFSGLVGEDYYLLTSALKITRTPIPLCSILSQNCHQKET